MAKSMNGQDLGRDLVSQLQESMAPEDTPVFRSGKLEAACRIAALLDLRRSVGLHHGAIVDALTSDETEEDHGVALGLRRTLTWFDARGANPGHLAALVACFTANYWPRWALEGRHGAVGLTSDETEELEAYLASDKRRPEYFGGLTATGHRHNAGWPAWMDKPEWPATWPSEEEDKAEIADLVSEGRRQDED